MTPTFKPENTISPSALFSVNYWTQLLILWVTLLQYQERMTLFSLNDTVCGLTCTAGAGKTGEEDGRKR